VHPAAADELADLDDRRYARVRVALARLADDPFRARPGLDLRRLKAVSDDVGLHRVRVGDVRALYAVLEAAREVLVLVVEKREAGYVRMAATAQRRLG
jgi:mRNA-degrading endonuclease RelE of RelBE toxin-antitoxin system